MDGLDIAYCEFSCIRKRWHFHIRQSETIVYKKEIRERLLQAGNGSALDLANDHHWYGRWQGEQVKKFIVRHKLKPTLISAHGHTLFHQPSKKISWQLGSGASLAAACGIDAVTDFRTTDIALGGQGAPLVPIGDEILFPEYDFCLNLGGFANISYREKKRRLAFDICPVNIVLNELSLLRGKQYDRGGDMARAGVISRVLLDSLNKGSYFRKKGPRSLGKEWVTANVLPLIYRSKASPEDMLSTYTEHISIQIAKHLTGRKPKILLTGGGAWNDFLIERIVHHSGFRIKLPDNTLIAFKEALVFAFLGLLRYRNEINTCRSVTGASRDSIGGGIYSGV